MIAIISNCNISTTQEPNNQEVNNQVEQIDNQQILQDPNYLQNDQQQQEQFQQYNDNMPINYNNDNPNNDNPNLGNQQTQEQFIDNNMQISTPEVIQGQNQVPVEPLNNKSNNDNSTGVITMNSNEIIEELYPENAFELFNNIKDANKENKQTLRVDIVLTKELCDAISKHDTNTLIPILLGKNASGVTRTELEKCIKNMLNKFNQNEDLQGILDYLKITDGRAIYYPTSTMKDWLKSLDCFKDIEDVAKPFLENNGDERAVQSYELRVSFYFRNGNNSCIKIPKKDALSLATNLKQCEKKLIKTIKENKNSLDQYKDVLDMDKKKQELIKLKEDENIKKIAEIEQEISKAETNKSKLEEKKKTEETNKNTLQTKKNEAETALQKINKTITKQVQSNQGNAQKNKTNSKNKSNNKNKKGNVANTTKQVLEPNPEWNKKNEEISQLATKISEVDKEIEKLNDEISKIDREIEKLKNDKKSLEEKCKETIENISKLEKEITNVDDKQLTKAQLVVEVYNKKIIKILQQAKEYFENKSPNNKK